MGKARIISCALQKGGSSKTTTSVNLSCYLAKLGYKVKILDFDNQGNTTLSFGIDPDSLKSTILNVLIGEKNIKDIIIKTDYGVDIIPANDDLADLDMIILMNTDIYENPAEVLKNALKEIEDDADFIIIDLPPSRGLLTINALTASTDVIIPMQAEYLATTGVNKILNVIEKVKEAYNPTLNLLGIVATMYDVRTSMSSLVLQEARKHFDQVGIKVFDTVIPKYVRFADSPMRGIPAAILYPTDEKVMSYENLAKEMFNIG